jgi:AAA domain, putative AbiEii toxin, Type IV TA system/AAA ATPase domain
MKIREIEIRNFRGLKRLAWRPTEGLVCLIGRGDVGKSTVLDAIEIALSPRSRQIADTDFLDADTTKSIEIEVTVGELPEVALEDGRFGLHLRGWQKNGKGLRDEPQDDDESVVTVRVVIDGSLEGEWALHTDRQGQRTLSPRDRTLFGVVRLGPEIEQHLTWGRYAALSNATNDRDAAVATLVEAFRAARDHVNTKGLPTLSDVATAATTEARRLGAYGSADYRVGLDTQRTLASLSSVSLHDGVVPVRLSGLGTRRLTSLAVQRMSVKEGAIVLIDEIEHGLEPHRIRHALKVLRDSVGGDSPRGQVFLTTHSPTTLVELAYHQLAICRSVAGTLTIRMPSGNVQGLLRRVPEALLAQRVLVCEGPTEMGVIRGLRDTWNDSHPFPFEARGAWLADGNGSQASATAIELAGLGYTVALFRDSDVILDGMSRTQLANAGCDIYEWDGGLATEPRMFKDVSRSCAQSLLDIACEAHTKESVLSQVASCLKLPNLPSAKLDDWLALDKSEDDIRDALGLAAKKRDWFKNVTHGERVGAVLGPEVRTTSTTPMAQLLGKVEAWLYA